MIGPVGIGLHGGHCCSHRLELMRQIYNMNESACPEDEEPPPPLVLAPPPAVLAQQQQQDILQCISACAQQTRLSLANLLPSRFVPPRWYAAARNKLVGFRARALFLSRGNSVYLSRIIMGPSKHIFKCGTEEYRLPNSAIAILLPSYKYDF